MAKHIKHGRNGKGKVSKGQRLSCQKLVKAPINDAITIDSETRVPSAMRNALVAVLGGKYDGVKKLIHNAAVRNFGNPKLGTGISMKLKFKTREALIEEGILIA